MRFFSKPASGRHSGNTLSASQEPPGRIGASHSSQANPSRISPSKLPTASTRVVRTEAVALFCGVFMEVFIGVAS